MGADTLAQMDIHRPFDTVRRAAHLSRLYIIEMNTEEFSEHCLAVKSAEEYLDIWYPGVR